MPVLVKEAREKAKEENKGNEGKKGEKMKQRIKQLEKSLELEIQNKEKVMEVKDRKAKELEDLAIRMKKEGNENRVLKQVHAQMEEELKFMKQSLKSFQDK